MEGGKTNEKTKKTDLHGTALHLLPVFYGFCAGIGGRNGAGGGNDYPVKQKRRGGGFHGGGFDFRTGRQYEGYCQIDRKHYYRYYTDGQPRCDIGSERLGAANTGERQCNQGGARRRADDCGQ